jgi:hypothetical protein
MMERKQTHFVFPNEHSTQPSSEPKVRVGVRISSIERPSILRDSFKALNINSFSGIEGEGGRILDETYG